MAIRDDIKDRVQHATDIVRLIGEQVALRPKGKEFAGLCPFHDDKNPSMQVSPAKQIYKCFSCGAGGDVFSFVMNYHKMTFPEAIKHLAERAGIEVQEQGSGFRDQGSGPSERDQLREANGRALEFFRALLKHPEHGRIAREYIERRGISPQMVADFQVGYAPDRWDGLVQMIGSRGWDSRGFELAGLVSQRDSGGLYDRLRHRLIFPIFDAIGRPIAFGGRKLREEDEPKYLNSPETKLFNKSATLYGLHLAKKPIIDSRTAVIVEGYTDVIACHQGGARNVVATLGTALTSEHVAELRRYAEKVVLIFDADEAGQKAADRAVELFLTGDLDVNIAILPDGLDPADLMALADGRQQWDMAIASADNAIAYKYRSLRNELEGENSITRKEKVVDRFLDDLVSLGINRQGMYRRNLIIKYVAELTGQLDDANIYNELSRRSRRRPHRDTPALPEQPVSPFDAFTSKALKRCHRWIIGHIATEPSLFHALDIDDQLVPEDMTGEEADVYGFMYTALVNDPSIGLLGILSRLSETGFTRLTGLLTSWQEEAERIRDATVFTTEAHVRTCIDFVRFTRDKREYERTKGELMGRIVTSEITDAEVDMMLGKMMRFLLEHPDSSRINKTAQRESMEKIGKQGMTKAYEAAIAS